jgi:hypothetical protein
MVREHKENLGIRIVYMTRNNSLNRRCIGLRLLHYFQLQEINHLHKSLLLLNTYREMVVEGRHHCNVNTEYYLIHHLSHYRSKYE